MVSIVQNFSRYPQSVLLTNPLSTGSELIHRFGKQTTPIGDFPKPIVKYFNNTYGGSNQSKYRVARMHYEYDYAYEMVNGLPLLYATSDITKSNITNTDLGSGLYGHVGVRKNEGVQMLPHLGLDDDLDAAGSRRDRYQYLGGLTHNLSMIWDNVDKHGTWVAREQGTYFYPVTPSVNPTPAYPDGDTTPYVKDSTNFDFNWDVAVGGDNVDLKNEIFFSQINISNEIILRPDLSVNSKYYADYTQGLNQIFTGMIRIAADTKNDPFADFMGNAVSLTLQDKFDMYLKSYKEGSTTEYIDFDITDALHHVERSAVNIEDDEIPAYDIHFMADTFEWEARDNLNNAAYWGVA